MFSKEENERLRREKLRGGDFKEKSSESSNEGSNPPSPCVNPSNFENHQNFQERKVKEKKKKEEDKTVKPSGNRKHKKN